MCTVPVCAHLLCGEPSKCQARPGIQAPNLVRPMHLVRQGNRIAVQRSAWGLLVGCIIAAGCGVQAKGHQILSYPLVQAARLAEARRAHLCGMAAKLAYEDPRTIADAVTRWGFKFLTDEKVTAWLFTRAVRNEI